MRRRNKKAAVYAFIDNQNLNLGTQKYGWKMNWRRFREFLREQYGVEKAYMFIGYMPENEELYNQMYDSGYLVVLKPLYDLSRPQPVAEEELLEREEKKPVKGNVDVELVLWAMREFPHYQKAIIISGDGDFYSLVEYLEEQGKLLHIMAPNRQYSSLLKPYENYIIRLDQHRRELEYRAISKKNKGDNNGR